MAWSPSYRDDAPSSSSKPWPRPADRRLALAGSCRCDRRRPQPGSSSNLVTSRSWRSEPVRCWSNPICVSVSARRRATRRAAASVSRDMIERHLELYHQVVNARKLAPASGVASAPSAKAPEVHVSPSRLYPGRRRRPRSGGGAAPRTHRRRRQIDWVRFEAGLPALEKGQLPLPQDMLAAVRQHKIALKTKLLVAAVGRLCQLQRRSSAASSACSPRSGR